MLTQELDRETERYLADILAQQNITSDALIRELIRDRWLALHPSSLTAPQPNLAAPTSTNASLHRPRSQKQTIADFVRRKNLGTQTR
jgi:hypothetical protein